MKKRSPKHKIEEIPSSPNLDLYIPEISKVFISQVKRKEFATKYASVGTVLKMAGAGVFIAGSLVIPNLPLALKPFLKNINEKESWKRFNIPYLKRSLERLETQKLISVKKADGYQIIEITNVGKRKILKYALDEIEIKKPKIWDGTWRLISYDIPGNSKGLREIFHRYLRSWKFFPLHESVFLHAYPCEKEIEFLREFLNIGEYVRIFTVSKIENDKHFREFFGV